MGLLNWMSRGHVKSTVYADTHEFRFYAADAKEALGLFEAIAEKLESGLQNVFMIKREKSVGKVHEFLVRVEGKIGE